MARSDLDLIMNTLGATALTFKALLAIIILGGNVTMNNFYAFASLAFVGIATMAIALLILFYAPTTMVAGQGEVILYTLCVGLMGAGIGAHGMGRNLN